jgi:NAD(P)-dependent dehydrogenase (short-subunit alcohol dehydrogenase family)
VSRVIVLGGYGGFGARIARRLAAAGHDVLVAGRSAAKAARFCEGVPGTVPLELDRADIAGAIARHRPAVVVDASGPFQAMDYAVPHACIAAGAAYCDIADGRAFVCGIAALDAQARQAGVAVVAGASSVPALSGAVVRELATGLDRVCAVEMAISASNQATAGPSVAAALLGQVGRPVTVRRAGRTERSYGWQEIARQDFALAGKTPIAGRLVALADVPDLALLPDRLAGRPAVRFRAGTELAAHNLALWLASWPVRWGLLRGLAGLGPFLQPLRRLTARFGSDRSAMVVRVFGEREGTGVERRWTLIAEKGDGPEIPALSIPLLIERILSGSEPTGARDAGLSLSLADYESALADLAVTHAVEEFAAPEPLYRRVIGPAFDALPNEVRAVHRVWRDGGAFGEATVEGSHGALGRLIARIMRFPPPGRHPLHVDFAEREGIETWTRDFGGHRFASRLSQRGSHLVEAFGPLRFQFDLPANDRGLTMVMRGWSALGIPLPLALAPRTEAREWAADGRFHFDVTIGLPLIGRIVRYQGWLGVPSGNDPHPDQERDCAERRDAGSPDSGEPEQPAGQ